MAMTTTGAAIHQRLLNQLEAPVVFVEEAAEILESNILAILTPHVKHMVLIGDHKQLKPNVRTRFFLLLLHCYCASSIACLEQAGKTQIQFVTFRETCEKQISPYTTAEATSDAPYPGTTL